MQIHAVTLGCGTQCGPCAGTADSDLVLQHVLKASASGDSQAQEGGAATAEVLRQAGVTPAGVELVTALLSPRQADRMSVRDALRHPWVQSHRSGALATS